MRACQQVLIIVMALCLVAHQASAQPVTLRTDAWTTDGPVFDIKQSNGITYIGGKFSKVIMNTGGGAALSMRTALPLALPRLNGTIYTVLPDGAGGWYVGGKFKTEGDTPDSNLVHIRSNGTFNPAWHPQPNSTVRALAQRGAIIYAGGEFTKIGGQDRRNIAALNVNTGLATPWNPDATIISSGMATAAGATVRTLAVDRRIIYVGGSFTNIGRASRNRLAALDSATGNATKWDPDANNAVRILTVSGSTVYAGGHFTRIGRADRNRLAALDTVNGNSAALWNPNVEGPNAYINAIEINGTTVYVGGKFTTVDKLPRNNITAIDAAGHNTGWDPTASDAVSAIEINGAAIYVAGSFTNIGSDDRKGIAALNVDNGRALPLWKPTLSFTTPSTITDDTVFTLAKTGLTIYAGGNFNAVDIARNNLAAFKTTTGRPTEWNPNAGGANAQVNALAMSGAIVYAGGTFTTMGSGVTSATRNRLAALDTVTGKVTTWNPSIEGDAAITSPEINAIGLAEKKIYIGGLFRMINVPGRRTELRTNLAALDTTTGEVSLWNASTTDRVRALVVHGKVVYIGGDFKFVNGTSRNLLAAVTASNGTLIPGWDPNANNTQIHALAVNGPTIYAGGNFSTLKGEPRSLLAAIDSANGMPTDWNPDVTGGTNPVVRTILLSGSTVYFGGEFAKVKGEPRPNLAAIGAAGTGVLTSWFPNPAGGSPPVTALESDDETIFAGGNFTSIARVSRSFFAPLGETPLNPVPIVSIMDQTSGERFQNLDVNFIGVHFTPDVTSVNVGSGIAVNSISVNSPTSLTANITITPNARTGVRNFTVSNNPPGGGTFSFLPFTIKNPAPTLTGIVPASGLRGQTFDVTVTGSKFISGVTSVSFGPNITVNSIIVNSATRLIANITIGASAVIGTSNVQVSNAFPGGGTATLNGAFTVGHAVPTLISLAPDRANRLQTLDVVFTGTSFIPGITAVNTGAGIKINAVTITSSTSLRANLTIMAAAAAGPRDFVVTNSQLGGGASEKKIFTINNPVPALRRMDPASAGRGQTHNVALIGANFINGASTVSFGSEITVNFFTVDSDTQITANISIPLNVTLGNRNVSVINATPGGGTARLFGGFAVVNPRPTLISVVPAIGALNQTLNVSLTGTNFIPGASSVFFGDDITINDTRVVNSTQIIANIKIENGAPLEAHDVSVGNDEPGGGGVTLTKAFAVVNGPVVGFSVPANLRGAGGDTIAIPLNIDPASRRVGSFDAKISFDPEILTYTDRFMEGAILSEANWQIDVHADGNAVRVSAFVANAFLTEGGTAATLFFHVHNAARLGATVALALSDLTATNTSANPLPTAGHDGLFTVSNIVINGNLFYYTNTKPIAGDSLRLAIADPAVLFAVSNADGFFQFNRVPLGQKVTLTPRQTTGNFPGGIITAGDALKAFKGREGGSEDLNGYERLAMDVTGDCKLDSGDPLAILKRATGSWQYFRGPGSEEEKGPRLDDWRFVNADFEITDENWCEAPDSRSYEPLLEDQFDQHFVGIIRGDVNGSFGAPIRKSAETSNGLAVTLSAPKLVAEEQFICTIEVSTADHAYNSFDLTLTYDAAAIRVTGVTLENLLAPKAWMVDWHATGSGILRVAGFSTTDAVIKGRGGLVTIQATLAPPPKEGESLRVDVPLALLGYNGKEIAAPAAGGNLKFVASLPQQYALEQNYPNPFLRQTPRASTTIKYALPEASAVSLRIYDVLGNLVRTLVDKPQNAGLHTAVWNGRNDDNAPVAKGIFFYQLQAGTFVKTNKLVLQ